MRERQARRESRGAIWLAVLAVSAYVLRLATSWWLSDRDKTRRFDIHGFGLFGDMILLGVLALPLAGLLWWILRRRGAWRGLFATASSPGWAALSVVLLIVLGAPTPNQVWAVILLPPIDAWPAMLSAVLWFATAAALRAVAVTGPR